MKCLLQKGGSSPRDSFELTRHHSGVEHPMVTAGKDELERLMIVQREEGEVSQMVRRTTQMQGAEAA